MCIAVGPKVFLVSRKFLHDFKAAMKIYYISYWHTFALQSIVGSLLNHRLILDGGSNQDAPENNPCIPMSENESKVSPKTVYNPK